MNNEVEKNLPLVSHVLNKYFHKWDEDMFQTGCLGLIRAVQTYDPTKSTCRSTYYVSCIKNEIGKEIRYSNRKKRGREFTTISLNEPIGEENLSVIDTIESTETTEEIIEKKEELIWLEKHILLLSELEQKVLINYYGLYKNKRKTQIEIATMLNTSQVNICRIVKRSIEKLKGMKESEDEII